MSKPIKLFFTILALLFLSYAIFGAIGNKILSPTNTPFLWWTLIVIVLVGSMVMNFLLYPPKNEPPSFGPIIVVACKGVKLNVLTFFSIILFGVLFLLTRSDTYPTAIENLIALWINLPSAAQISPYISIILSVASFWLALQNYRLQRRKDERDDDEFISKKKQRDSKIVRPSSEEITKYSKK